LQRLNKKVKRRADVPGVGLRPPEDRLGIFPNEARITRLIGAVLLEQNEILLRYPRRVAVRAALMSGVATVA
jgi:hypothetical protein